MAPPRNATNPVCPNPAHAGSRVRIHGTYRPSHRGRACLHHARVRFLCVRPPARPHTFSTGRRLPRDGECDACDRGFTLRDGPLAPRRFMHVVPDIARALVLAGQGQSYRRAGRLVRVKSGVVRFHPKRAARPQEGGSDWGLVADWIELYAQAATRGSLPEAWPAGGIIVDQIPFSAGGQVYNQSGAPRGTRTTWSIACVMGPHGPGNRLQMLRMRAFPGKSGTAAYEELFRELPGRPAFVLADGESSIRSAAQRVWPGITVHVAFDKLELQLKQHLIDARLRGSVHPLWSQMGKWDSRDPAQRSIFRDLARWTAYCDAVRAAVAAGHAGARAYLAPWVRNHEHAVAAQIIAMPFWPHEATAMEHAQAKVRAAFEGRSWPMRNQARTNRLLDLMTCELAETARQRSYARRIRDHLEGSLPLALRHQVYRAPRLH